MSEVANQETAVKKPGLVKSLMIPVVIGIVCAGIGFSIPLALPGMVGGEKHVEEHVVVEPMFLPFGDVVVNLNEGRMNRYLRMSITLQLRANHDEHEAITAMLETKKSILTSWLIGYLADMSMEDIRGAAGQNRLRREIQDEFNAVLFPEGDHELEEVLFEEFNVQ